MINFLKTIVIVVLASVSFIGCAKKSILSDDPGNLSSNNVQIKIFPYWNNYLYNADSLYFAGGAFFKIDDISILHSDYYFVNDGDTLPKSDPTEWKLSKGGDVMLGYLEAGSYSGFYRYKVGLDATTNAKSPADFPASNPLSQKSLYRGANEGYNFVTITGRVQDPAKPNSEPSIPLSWVIATDDFSVQYGMGQSFNVVAGRPVTFVVILDMAKLFEGLYPITTPIIKCDPSDPSDFGHATTLYNNFKNKVYKLQL
jgi:hypothetical protein